MNEEMLKEVLRKNKIQTPVSLTKFQGGVVNDVYDIDDTYVVKVERDLDVTPHQPELIEKALQAGAKVPKILDYGAVSGKNYLLMEKIRGAKLSESWLRFSKKQKESMMSQIVEQLKIFHSIQFEKYSCRRPIEFENYRDATINFIKFEGKEPALLVKYFNKYVSILDETGTAVFVHNDIHFENILHDGDELTGIIDFDFVRQAPKDYELWHILDFFRFPTQYIEDSLKASWEGYDGAEDITLLKKYYPELFSHSNLLVRLRLYFIDEIISALHDGAIEKFKAKVECYFKSNWLERQLS